MGLDQMKLRNKKTGEIVKVADNFGEGQGIVVFADMDYHYASLAELNDEWEDYKSTEPLIEDEKVRKVFREWAEFFGAERFRVTHLFRSGKKGTTIIRSTDLTTEPSIELPGYIGEDTENYTKIELCGEEE